MYEMLLTMLQPRSVISVELPPAHQLQGESYEGLSDEQKKGLAMIGNVVHAWGAQARFLSQHSLTCVPR